MLRKSALAAVALFGSATVCLAQETPRYDVGKVISTAFLVQLTDPERTGYRVGVVHQEAGTGMLLPFEGSGDSIEFIRGTENFLWGQAAEQLLSKQPAEPIRLAIRRRKLDPTICPELSSPLQAFLHELEAVLSRQTALSEPSPAKYRRIGPEGEEIILDAAGFWIQVSLTDATVIVTPDGGSEPPLQQAAYRLHSIVSGCASSLTSTVEEHDF